jgi:hypothetical protein
MMIYYQPPMIRTGDASEANKVGNKKYKKITLQSFFGFAKLMNLMQLFARFIHKLLGNW